MYVSVGVYILVLTEVGDIFRVCCYQWQCSCWSLPGDSSLSHYMYKVNVVGSPINAIDYKLFPSLSPRWQTLLQNCYRSVRNRNRPQCIMGRGKKPSILLSGRQFRDVIFYVVNWIYSAAVEWKADPCDLSRGMINTEKIQPWTHCHGNWALYTRDIMATGYRSQPMIHHVKQWVCRTVSTTAVSVISIYTTWKLNTPKTRHKGKQHITGEVSLLLLCYFSFQLLEFSGLNNLQLIWQPR